MVIDHLLTGMILQVHSTSLVHVTAPNAPKAEDVLHEAPENCGFSAPQTGDFWPPLES